MRIEARSPRSDWQSEVARWGLVFHTNPPDAEGRRGAYWDESQAVILSDRDVDALERATAECYQICLDTVQAVLSERRLTEFGIPEAWWPAIEMAWRTRQPSLYGRFDFAYNGTEPPKLLEFNADTPTSLLEAAVIQWQWLQATQPGADQFNSIWEGLVETWRRWREQRRITGDRVVFATQDEVEDFMTVSVLQDTLQEAGGTGETVLMEQIGWQPELRRFTDLQEVPIDILFKLYPWEFMWDEPFGEYVIDSDVTIHWIEPLWKMVLSNKNLLPVLWERYPNHPNLLPAYADSPRQLREYVSKPALGREGANTEIVTDRIHTQTAGPYGNSRRIYQSYSSSVRLHGQTVVTGSWIIGGEARGVGFRVTNSHITDNFSRFVPHLIGE